MNVREWWKHESSQDAVVGWDDAIEARIDAEKLATPGSKTAFARAIEEYDARAWQRDGPPATPAERKHISRLRKLLGKPREPYDPRTLKN